MFVRLENELLPSESVERLDFEKTRAWRGTAWSAGSSNRTLSRLFRALLLHRLLREFKGWRKVDRYFDTGESGETYDAEMEAASSKKG